PVCHLSFFLLPTPRPPRPPLFPYTTLFRSRKIGNRNHARARVTLGRAKGVELLQIEIADACFLLQLAQGGGVKVFLQAYKAAGQDRKSTRLNSSHVKISYAVFCLKKKKNKK